MKDIKINNNIILAAGCFWCVEAIFKIFKGITTVTPGYIGGISKRPTYEEVCKGDSGHAEAVKIEYESDIITLDNILDIYFVIHDPTQLNRQGNDIGTQYRSALFYNDKGQRKNILMALERAKALWGNSIVTEVNFNLSFYAAEQYHKDYFNKNPNSGYCQIIINPKLEKVKSAFSSMLKI